MTIVATNNITVSNVNDGKTLHTAYAYSSDGTDRFTTVYPNLNLLDGTKDFSGTWTGAWMNDGTYKGLNVKKSTGMWNGLYKAYTVTREGDYTGSVFVKSFGGAKVYRYVSVNGTNLIDLTRSWDSDFDWEIDSFTVKNLKPGDVIKFTHQISTPYDPNRALWTAGHKWEFGSTATNWMPSASEVKTTDYPSYIGQYTDFTQADSTDPLDYTWGLIRGEDGKTSYAHTAYAYSTDGTDRFTTAYPNLNLLTDSKEFKNKNIASSVTTTSITSSDSTIIKDGDDTYLNFIKSTQPQDWFRAYLIRGSSVYPNFPNVGIKPNSQYTFSVLLKGTGTHQIIVYNLWTIPNNITLTVNLTDTWTKYVLTVNTATTIPTENAQFLIRSSTIGSEINLKYPKVEEGSTATNWMPSASEVTDNDYPSYRGEYSDFSPTSSTDPSKYSWSLIRGNTSYSHTAYAYNADGADRFTTVYPNLNLFTGTSDKPSTKTGGGWNVAVIGVYKTPKVGQKYTVSVEVPNADHTVWMEVYRWNAAGGRLDNIANKWVRSGEKGYLTFTWTDPGNSGATQFAANLAWTNGTDTGSYSYCKAKLELGLIATPYMPSSTEITTADYPSYRGEYSDFSSTSSTDPSKYSWSLIRGNSSYSHTAYSWSPDGADRFTTVYPNINLLKDTRTPRSLTGNNTGNQTGSLYSFDNGKNVQNQGLSVGDTLTCEFDWEVSNPISGSFYVQLNGTNWQRLSQPISITSENKSGHSKFSFVVDAGFLAGVANAINIRADYLPTDSVLTISNVNFTKGSTATPHMPSASEVKTSDYPSYIGTYSDTNVDGSTDPSKYTWAVFKGVDGIAGQPGANAPTITNVQDQIYLSTSNTAQSGGSWGILIPTWSSGKYYWSRVATTFDNGTTTYSTPVLDEALNQAATNQVKVTQLTQDLDGFKTTVSNTYLSKSDASGTYADKVSVASQITQSATAVTSNVQTWTNNKLTAYSTTQQTTDSITSAVANKADKSQITQLSDSINLKVSKGDVISSINQESGQIVFNANKLVLNANTTEITGDAFIGGDMIVDGTIKAKQLDVEKISSISSDIGEINAGSFITWDVLDKNPSSDMYTLTATYINNGIQKTMSILSNIEIDKDTPISAEVVKSITINDISSGRILLSSANDNGINSELPSHIIGITPDELLKNSYLYTDAVIESGSSVYSGQRYTNLYLEGDNIVLKPIHDPDTEGYIGALPWLNINHEVSISRNLEVSNHISANGRSLSQRASVTKGIYYTLSWTFRRIGDIVYVDVPRQRVALARSAEEDLTTEGIPIGFRPAYDHPFSLSSNVGSTVGADVLINMLGDNSGNMRVTNTTTTFKMVQGSTSYITNDPFPS